VSLGLLINPFKPKLHCKVWHFSDIGSNYQDGDICDILRTRKLSSCVR